MNNSAAKVGEIFREAGTAFNKLSEMTMLLHPMGDSQPGGKWTEEEIEMLRGCVHRFAVDLNKLSQHIKNRTVSQIRTTLKKKAFEGAGIPVRQPTSSESEDENETEQSSANEDSSDEYADDEDYAIREPKPTRKYKALQGNKALGQGKSVEADCNIHKDVKLNSNVAIEPAPKLKGLPASIKEDDDILLVVDDESR